METEKLLCALKNLKVGGKSSSINIPIVTSSGAYASGDVIGLGGAIKVPSVMLSDGGTGILKSVTVKDDAAQSSDLTILVFNEDPSVGATITDNAAFAWGPASFSKLVTKIEVVTANYKSVASKSVADLDDVSIVLQTLPTSQDLWIVVVAGGTPTYGSANAALSLRFGFLLD